MLISGLSDEDLHRQHDPLMSPIIWDVGHIAHFEELWLTQNLDGPIEFSEMPGMYNPFEHPRATRASLALPTLSQMAERLSDMMSDANRERLMTASFLGGQAIAMGFVGVVHPLSAGLSVVLGTHHCVANCIVMNVMSSFYPEASREFRQMVLAQGVEAPTGIGNALSDEQCERLYAASIIHEKPLTNALGPGFRDILQPATVIDLFRAM